MIKLKLVDKKNHNKSLSVDILIGSYYIWNIFENKINRVESWTPITMETVAVCYIMVSCQTSEFSKFQPNLSVIKIYESNIKKILKIVGNRKF